MIVKDQLNRELRIDHIPLRIVSLVPSQTELLVDLGLENNIVGITKFCVHPQNLRKHKVVVGGTKKVHYNKIKALQPDIILCNKEENTREMVMELEKIAPVHISDIFSIEDSLELIIQYGVIFKKEKIAESLVDQIETEICKFRETLKKPLKVAYLIWKDPWMVAGKNTFINSLIELNGWENVIETRKNRYPEVDLLQLSQMDLDLILLSTEPYPFKEKHKIALGNHLAIKAELVDGEYFSWYGSRLLPAVKYFREFQIKLSSSL